MEEYNTQKTPQPNKRLVIYASIALTCIAAGAFAFILLNNNRKPVVLAPMATPPSEKAVTQTAPPPLPTARSVTQAPSPTPAPPGQAVQPPPHEVLDFIKDVQAIETHRKAYLNDKSSENEMLKEMLVRGLAWGRYLEEDDNDLGSVQLDIQKVQNSANKRLANWQNLIRSFNTLSSPPSCRQFAGAYYQVLLSETQCFAKVSEMARRPDSTDIGVFLQTLNEAMTRGQLSIQSTIDKQVDTANEYLDALCKQYGIAKPFSVYKESGGGSILLPR